MLCTFLGSKRSLIHGFSQFIHHADEPQQLSINCGKLIRIVLVFVPHRLAFQILPRIYFCCGRVEETVSVKKTHKNVWTFKWCRVWIKANNLKSKMGTCLACTALYRYWMVYHHGHILAKQVAVQAKHVPIFDYDLFNDCLIMIMIAALCCARCLYFKSSMRY